MSFEQGEMRLAAAPPLDDGNLLSEILLRLSQQPSSLPRASLVSKRWLSLVSDPRFLRRFRIHHRPSAPLLGFFDRDLVFVPTLEPPNLLPYGRFSLQLDRRDGDRLRLLGCRHGLVLIFHVYKRFADERSHVSQDHIVVWDPVTGDQHRIAFPPGFDAKKAWLTNGAVLRCAGEVYFQVVLVLVDNKDKQMLACVYSSETGAWGDLISALLPSQASMRSIITIVVPDKPAVLIGSSLYWLLFGGSPGILEFDLDRQKLAVIPSPLPEIKFDPSHYSFMRGDGGGLGFLFLSGFSAQLWKRETDSHGVASWVLARTIDLEDLLSLNPEFDHNVILLAFAEYNNVALLRTFNETFMIQLESLQLKKFLDTHALCCAFETVWPCRHGHW